MTTNAFIFMWCELGIEAVVPITQYEDQDKIDAWAILKGDNPGANPLDGIIKYMRLRAQVNGQRRYEIYAIDCPEGVTEDDLLECWDQSPQYMADLTREKGVPILANSSKVADIKIR